MIGVFNVGKFFLLNCLVRWDVVIVIDIFGMMWDIVEVCLVMVGFLVVILDMAGFCEVVDVVEVEGVCWVLDCVVEVDFCIGVVDVCFEEELLDL